MGALSGNQLYPKGKQALLEKKIDVEDTSGTDQLKCALIKHFLVTAGDGDEFFNSISGNQVGSSVALASTAVNVVRHKCHSRC